MIKDLNALYDTNNCVMIFNGMGKRNDGKRTQILFTKFDVSKKYPGTPRKKPSDVTTLQRVGHFVRPWFIAMRYHIQRLCLLMIPRTRGECKLLVAYPPCTQQKYHWDFDPETVQSLIQNKQFEGVPLSCICSFTPTG